MLADELNQADHTAAGLKELQRQREEVRVRVDTLFETYSPAQLKEGRDAVARLQHAGVELDDRIARLNAGRQRRRFDPRQIAREMVEQLTDFSAGWPDLPPALAKEAAAALISRAEVDLDTRHVEFELVLPQWKPIDRKKAGRKDPKQRKLLVEPRPTPRVPVDAMGAKKPAGSAGPLCLVAGSGISPGDEAQQRQRPTGAPMASLLARVRCRYRRGGHGRPTSYRCRCASPRRSPRPGA